LIRRGCSSCANSVHAFSIAEVDMSTGIHKLTCGYLNGTISVDLTQVW
jgi:hypothetical protein